MERSKQGTVLIVDDNPANLGVLSDCLSNSGFEVLVAQDGESAIDRANYANPDLILLDVLMPEIDGFETCRRLKANPSTRDIPVIFMTALSETEQKLKGFQVGAVDYITKPFQHQEVLARITTHLTIRHLNQQLQQQNSSLQHTVEALQQSEQRFQRLTANVPGMIYQFLRRTDGSIAFPYVSANSRELFQLEAEVIQQDANAIIELIHADDRQHFEESVAISAETLKPWHWEGRFVLPSGQIRWVQGASRPQQQDNGDILWDGIVTDITTIKEAEVAVRQALNQEQELNQLKSRFLSTASHEFRTPLTTILSSAQILENYYTKLTLEKQLIHLQRVQISVQQMTELLDEVLFLSKAEAGKVTFNPTPLDLPTFCHELIEQLQQGVGRQHGIDFTYLHVPDVSAAIPIYLDEKLLRHILENLLANAIKYSPHGSTVHFCLICTLDQVSFKIQDQGIGIPLDDQKRLFESFYRASNAANIKGTGLGLAIVKNCVDLHGGHIEVESQVDEGSTFTVTLPSSVPAPVMNQN